MVRMAAVEHAVRPTAPDEEGGTVTGRWPEPFAIRDRWTADDLATLPDDGLRYEIIDGTLVVSPSPRPIHQVVAANLYDMLRPVVLPGYRLLFAPLDWKITETTVLEPDLLMVPAGAIDELVGTPLLVIEILSPSTSRIDRVLKFSVYEQAGVSQYWIVDPGSDDCEPSIEVYDLVGGPYRLRARTTGQTELVVTEPLSVAVMPSALIR